jgi:hypothetical protein
MHFKLTLCAVLSLTLAAGPVRAASQKPNGTKAKEEAAKPKLSPEELREALAIADSFIKRFRESNDMDLIIKDLFASGFGAFLAGDSSWAGLVGLPFPLVEHLDQKDRERCYSTQFSIEYIMRLYLGGKVPVASEGKEPSASVLPPEVVRFIESNQLPEREVKTKEEARETLAMFERSLTFLRDHLLSPRPEGTDQFKQNLAWFEKHLDDPENNLGRPVLRVLRDEVAGYPAGTRLIAMEIPFHVALLLVRENGELKVLFAMSQIPPD